MKGRVTEQDSIITTRKDIFYLLHFFKPTQTCKNLHFPSLLVNQTLRAVSFVKTSQAIKVWEIGWMMRSVSCGCSETVAKIN